jgi:hypothetical protein
MLTLRKTPATGDLARAGLATRPAGGAHDDRPADGMMIARPPVAILHGLPANLRLAPNARPI